MKKIRKTEKSNTNGKLVKYTVVNYNLGGEVNHKF